MKATESFKTIIENHLKVVAENDSLFKKTLQKENKNIDDCITYILNEVKKSGCNGFADEEIFGMAIHYYDEDDIKPGKAVNCGVVVNHTAQPTTKTTKSKSKPAPKKKMVKLDPKKANNQTSIFDFI